MTTEALHFIDPRIHLVFTVGFGSQPDLDAVAKLRPGWIQVRDIPVDAQMYTRLYSSAAPRTAQITLESFSLHLQPTDGSRAFDALSRVTGPIAVERIVRVFPERVCAIRMVLVLPGSWLSSEISAFINESLDGRLLWDDPEESRYGGGCTALLADIVDVLAGSRNQGADEFPYFESFSVIEPRTIEPLLASSGEYLKAPWDRSVFEAAIRRIEYFDEIDMDVPRRVQRNLGYYRGDLIYLNYHNLFVFVADGPGHLPASFYIEGVETLKVLIAVLYRFDLETFRLLSTLRVGPGGVRQLRMDTEVFEADRLTILRTLDTFRLLTGASASRARWFLAAAFEVFGIGGLRDGLQEKLREEEFVLSSRYSVSLQKYLQYMGIAVGALSLVVTAVGLAIGLGG